MEIQNQALKLMKADSTQQQKLYFVEHTPVITMGRKAEKSNLLVSTDRLTQKGIDCTTTSRGGDITWHGPGQWTVYPILRLDRFCRDLHKYMRLLEEFVIVYLSRYGIEGGRVEGKTGVWVRSSSGTKNKLAAIGVSASCWISFHGVAINICPEMSAFRELIIPCGINSTEGGVTSLSEITGQGYDMEKEAQVLTECFCEVFPFATH